MIKNAISKILGTDSHSLGGSGGSDSHGASLSGSLSISDGDTDTQTMVTTAFIIDNSGTSREDDAPDRDVLVNVVKAGSTVIIACALAHVESSFTSPTWEVREGGVLKDSGGSINVSSQSLRGCVMLAVIHNVGDGNHTYDWQWGAQPGGNSIAVMSAIVIEIDDTHEASLTGSSPSDTHALSGSNNQKTVSSGIIK